MPHLPHSPETGSLCVAGCPGTQSVTGLTLNSEIRLLPPPRGVGLKACVTTTESVLMKDCFLAMERVLKTYRVCSWWHGF